MKRTTTCNLAILTCLNLWTALPSWGADIPVTDADIVGNVTWEASNTYVLNGFVFVEAGETLTIQAGTVVKGKPGQGAAASALVVARGGKIFAYGTPDRPIIFTAEADDVSDPFDFGATDRGLWGGVILLGNATLNSPVASGTPIFDNIEGIPVTELRGLYGGNDDNDSSGVMRYVSIRHGGSNIGADNEINGLTLGGIGRGTVIEYVEVFANQDDGFEFFGGAPQTRYLIAAFCGDDAFDYDQGFHGKGQFWFSIADVDADNSGEHDGDIDDFTKLPLTNPDIYNVTYIGNGATSGVAHRALRIRENAAGKYINSIFTDFGGLPGARANGIQIDAPSDLQLASGNLNLHDNLWWGFGAGNGKTNVANNLALPLFDDAARNNIIANPMLRGIDRNQSKGLDPRPAPGSPALSTSAAPPNDGFFKPAAYKGAFGADLWLSRWTFLSTADYLPDNNHILNVTDASITGNTTWYSTNVYLLNGFVFVEDGETLTIEPGTVIKGKPGQGAAASALIVARGGKIFAEGTPANPIVFTAQDDDVNDPFDFGSTDRGLWGGLILLGKATLNSPIASGSPINDNIEGIPVTELRGLFGGNDDNDNSGVLRYVSIRHGGSNIGADNEINGLTLGAVGRGTTVEFIEVFANQDDGVEFFGGTVQTKYIVTAFCGDDFYDYDQGFRGQGQFWFAIADIDADNSGEHDGDIDDFTKLPLTNPDIYNVTYIGNGATSGVAHRALRIRENAAGKYINSIFTDFGGVAGARANGIQIDAPSDAQLASGNLDLRENFWWGFGAGLDKTNVANNLALPLFNDTARNNLIADPMINSISRDGIYTLDPRLAAGSPARSATLQPPSNGFFETAHFKGAFADVNWASDWTFLSASALLNPNGGGNPMKAAPVGPTPPVLSIVLNGPNVEIRFASEIGETYQLTSTINVADPNPWPNNGGTVAGTGGVITLTRSASGAGLFFEVVTVP